MLLSLLVGKSLRGDGCGRAAPGPLGPAAPPSRGLESEAVSLGPGAQPPGSA